MGGGGAAGRRGGRGRRQPLLDELAGSPSRADGLLFVADAFAAMCGLCDGWGGPALPRLRVAIALVVASWSASLDGQAHDQAGDAAAVARLRARQCVASMYGVLAFSGADDLELDELRHLACLLLAAHSGYVFAADSAQPPPAAFAALRARVDVAMSGRAAALAAAAARDAAMLDAAVRPLLPQHVPPVGAPPLAWAATTDPRFEAVTQRGHLLSVNFLTGALLLDGSPPGSLPADVLQHPLYARVFGSRDFEVWRTETGALHTKRPLAGHFFYKFFLHSDGSLAVAELDASAGREGVQPARLELLPASDDDGAPEWCVRA